MAPETTAEIDKRRQKMVKRGMGTDGEENRSDRPFFGELEANQAQIRDADDLAEPLAAEANGEPAGKAVNRPNRGEPAV